MMKTTDRGFLLAYAMIVTSFMLIIGASIFTIAIKELKISRLGLASQTAYYAAESGAECALFWIVQGEFQSGSKTLTCNGQNFTYDADARSVHTFSLTYPPESYCVEVAVDSGAQKVYARGYNTCDASKLRTERAIELSVIFPIVTP